MEKGEEEIMGFLIKVVVGWILFILIIYVGLRIANIWGKVGIIIKVCLIVLGLAIVMLYYRIMVPLVLWLD